MSAAQTHAAGHLSLRAMVGTTDDFSGPALNHLLENLRRRDVGIVTTYDKPLSGSDHDAIAVNMLWLAVGRHGERAHFYSDDEKRASLIGRTL